MSGEGGIHPGRMADGLVQRLTDPLPMVIGRQDPDDWKVLLVAGGREYLLTSDEARKLGADLFSYANWIDGADPQRNLGA